MTVLILGGYGVFGGRLARMLIEDGADVVVAGRSLAKAKTFRSEWGGTTDAFDARDETSLAAALATHAPEVVVDASGPFQAYGDDPYRVARAVLSSGAHYLDLSDDAAFTKGISALDPLAKERGRAALSGVSSVPALSSTVVAELARGFDDIALISSAILPGNRAPRGVAVMASILGQAGAEMRVWRGNVWRKTKGWSGHRVFDLESGMRRPGAFIGAPDLALFPAVFGARSVVFRAGLGLPLLHHGLAALAWLRGKGALPDLARFTKPFHWIAERFERLGTDRGGMQVVVAGRLPDHSPVTRRWTLVAEAGDGPFIPSIPARILIAKLAQGTVPAGARPAIDAFSLDEAEAELSRLTIRTKREDIETPRLFEGALGAAWTDLPRAVRDLHDLWDLQSFAGTAAVSRGTHPVARLLARIFGFPPASDEMPVTVTLERRGDREIWTRDFGGHVFHSTLRAATPGRLYERFGPVTVELEPVVTDGTLSLVLHRGWCLGIPLPKALLPRSDVRESGGDGRFHFDIDISIPLIGEFVGYRGWLTPQSDPLEPTA